MGPFPMVGSRLSRGTCDAGAVYIRTRRLLPRLGAGAGAVPAPRVVATTRGVGAHQSIGRRPGREAAVDGGGDGEASTGAPGRYGQEGRGGRPRSCARWREPASYACSRLSRRPRPKIARVGTLRVCPTVGDASPTTHRARPSRTWRAGARACGSWPRGEGEQSDDAPALVPAFDGCPAASRAARSAILHSPVTRAPHPLGGMLLPPAWSHRHADSQSRSSSRLGAAPSSSRSGRRPPCSPARIMKCAESADMARLAVQARPVGLLVLEAAYAESATPIHSVAQTVGARVIRIDDENVDPIQLEARLSAAVRASGRS